MSLAVMGIVAALLFGALVSAVVHLGYSVLRPRIERLPAHVGRRVLLALLAAPATVGLSLAGLAILPGLAAVVFPSLDHCTHHGDHHFHLCLMHSPGHLHFGLPWLLPLAVAAYALLGLLGSAARVLRGQQLLTALRRSARRTEAGYHEVPSEAPLAITAGLLAPRVYVTTGLLRQLDGPYREAVLAHERAHVRRRDPLARLVAELLGELHGATTRDALLADFTLCCERACDEDAAAAIGDRTAVAGALVELGRMVAREPLPPTPLAARFGEGSLSARVHALLEAPKPAPAPSLPSRRLALLGAITLGALACAPLHHLTETALGALFG